jgi:hypothetical protein
MTSPYTVRINTKISELTDERLRLLVMLTRQTLSEATDEALNRGLPSLDDLKARLGRGNGGPHS